MSSNIPKRLLVVRLSAMGDVAMTVPVIIALARAYPEVKFFMLSRKRFQHLFTSIPQVHFIEADLDGLHKGVPGLYRLSKTVLEYNIDAIADLHNVLRTKVLRSFLFNIDSAVIDKGRADKKRLIKDPDFFEPLPHATDRYAEVFKTLGYQFDLQKDEFLSASPLSKTVLEATGPKQGRWIGVAPFAAHTTKALKVNRAKKLVQQLAALENIKVLLLGGGQEEIKKLQLVAATTKNVTVVAGKLSFKDELNLISHLDVMIAMDSGNGHLAAMFQVPTITLWGNTHPYAGFAPYAQPQENQLTADRKRFPRVPTSIFGNKKVKGYKKITNTIKIKRVLGRVKSILEINP